MNTCGLDHCFRSLRLILLLTIILLCCCDRQSMIFVHAWNATIIDSESTAVLHPWRFLLSSSITKLWSYSDLTKYSAQYPQHLLTVTPSNEGKNYTRIQYHSVCFSPLSLSLSLCLSLSLSLSLSHSLSLRLSLYPCLPPSPSSC